jgi:MFS family permease
MTTYRSPIPAVAPAGNRPDCRRLDLQPVVWALAVTHFVSRAGGVVRSFLVLYLTQERQLSLATAGAVVAAVGVGDVGSQLLGGWLGDWIGRRHTMLVGFLGTAVALVALGSADTVPAIWAAAVGFGLMAELFRPAGSAAVADLPARQRVRAFGVLFWAANLGFSVATVTGGILARSGYGLLFWINAVASIVAALIVWRRVPESRRPTSKQSRRALLPVLLRDRPMIAMAGINVAYFTLFLQTFATLPLVMSADGRGSATYGAVLALNGAVVVVVQPLAVRLLAGRDRSTVLAVSMLLVGIGVGLGIIVHSGAGYAGSVLVWTLGEIGVAVMFGATFADLAPADLRGRYMGIASTTWSIGAVFGPLTGTALLDHAGRATLSVTCLATGIALVAAQLALTPALRVRTSPQGHAAGSAAASGESHDRHERKHSHDDNDRQRMAILRHSGNKAGPHSPHPPRRATPRHPRLLHPRRRRTGLRAIARQRQRQEPGP